MQLQGKAIVSRLKYKNRGNLKLFKAIDLLINDLENAELNTQDDFRMLRRDAEKVHNKGFYFLDITVHRVLILLLLEAKQVKIIWTGNHKEYERIFKNNKNSIEKWLKQNKLLQ